MSTVDLEQALRVDLAACYRLIALYRWDDLVFTHISARVPGPEHHFLINPYGMLFEEITASSLIKVASTAARSRRARSREPSGLRHPQRHPRRTKRRDLRPAYAYARRHRRRVAARRAPAYLAAGDGRALLARLPRLRGHRAPRRREAAASARPRRQRALILRTTACLTVGATVADAFLAMYNLQRACEIQIAAQSSGAKLIPISPHIVAGVKSNLALVTKGLGAASRGQALAKARPDGSVVRQ